MTMGNFARSSLQPAASTVELADVVPKVKVKGKAQVSGVRSGERAFDRIRMAVTHWWPLGRWSLHWCRTIHPFAASNSEEPRRRLSLCSLPVPKQFVVSLRSLISFAQWPTCRTWQSAYGI